MKRIERVNYLTEDKGTGTRLDHYPNDFDFSRHQKLGPENFMSANDWKRFKTEWDLHIIAARQAADRDKYEKLTNPEVWKRRRRIERTRAELARLEKELESATTVVGPASNNPV